MVSCDYCGSSVDSNDIPLTWSTAMEGGQMKLFCDRCSREHLRSMEGKLDTEFW